MSADKSSKDLSKALSTSAENAVDEVLPKEWDTPEMAKKFADVFRAPRDGLPIRHGVELGKRVHYTKGEKMMAWLMKRSENSKVIPHVQTRAQAIYVGNLMAKYEYIHRSVRSEEKKKILQPHKNHEFVPEGYYTWMYDGDTFWRNIGTAVMVLGAIFFVLHPVWPKPMKTGVWYLSVTFLLFTSGFLLLRFIVFLFCWFAGKDVWIFPNLFDEELGVADSFKPWISVASSPDSDKKYRLIAIAVFAAFCGWVYNQPTNFDEYLEITKQFTEDIYEGKLLSDESQEAKENIDNVKIPDLEDLMKDDEEDNMAYDDLLHTDDDVEVDEDSIFEKIMEEDEVIENKDEL